MKRTILAALTLSVLAGCGGGSSDNGSPVSLKGKAIDGYIIGATVFLDLNFDGQLGSNEPSVVTQEEGEFDLTVPSQYSKCAQYVPVVVEVPVGAIDTDTPDEPIEEAYSMVFPPQFALTTDQDLLNLTPLTSVVWNQVEKELRESTTKTLSCDAILKGEEIRQDISQRLLAQEQRVAYRYNVAVTDLYGDYVASGKTNVHNIAKAIVPSLQKSYTETKKLIDANQNADFAWVEYFSGEWSTSGHYRDNWYRQEMVQTSNGNFTLETYEVSDDLDTKLELFDKQTMKTTQRDGINIQQTVGIEKTKSGDYGCAVDEALETLDKPYSYGIRNTLYANTNSWDDCVQLDSEGDITQSALTKNYSGTGELISYSEHTYQPGTDSGFQDLINKTDTIIKSDLITAANKVKNDFYDEESYGADYWFRARNEFGNDPSQIMTTHDKDGNWIKSTYYKNGTFKKECGKSEDSVSVSQCKSE